MSPPDATARRGHGKKKHSRPKLPTCFGRRATNRAIGPRSVSDTAGDVIIGDAGPNTISGCGCGVDRICGGRGNDQIRGDDDVLLFANGGAGADFIVGGEGNNRLPGGDGNDRVVDVVGNDRPEGDAGNDTLEDEVGEDTDGLVGGPGFDIRNPDIGDFFGLSPC